MQPRNLVYTAGWRLAIGVCLAISARVALADDGRPKWSEVAPGVLRSPGWPCAYCLLDGNEGQGLMIGAARGADLKLLREEGVKPVELVLLTHYHRDSTARAAEWLQQKIVVRAPAESKPWLTPAGLAEFWRVSLPQPTPGREPPLKERTFGLWNYLAPATIPEGIDCTISDGEKIAWRGWRLQAVATPGHSPDHFAFIALRSGPDIKLIFAGDALSSAGKLWSPYTTDWDHWTDKGLAATAASLRRLAKERPDFVCPEHGEVIAKDATAALEQTAAAAEEAAFLKSFERYTKERLGNPPKYEFLAPKQVATPGDQPWTRLSEHLFLTGNTYALASRDGKLLLVDPYGEWINDRLHELKKDHQLGPVEVAMVSHAHNDHYKGLFLLPDRGKIAVWTLAQVAQPLAAPYLYCAPYLDARSVKAEKVLKDGERATWREYGFRFHHLPGQTEFTMGVETEIDGHKCYFTADNFFHADQFSGSGGWSGRNRALPLPYAASAQRVLAAAPDWVLAEHGGAMEFSAEDFRRRVAWAKAAAAACDALSSSGDHRRDWDPQRVRVEPLLHVARPGETLRGTLVAANPTSQEEKLTFTIDEPAWLVPFKATMIVPAGETVRQEFALELRTAAPAGRHVVPVVVHSNWQSGNADVTVRGGRPRALPFHEDAADTFLVIGIP